MIKDLLIIFCIIYMTYHVFVDPIKNFKDAFTDQYAPFVWISLAFFFIATFLSVWLPFKHRKAMGLLIKFRVLGIIVGIGGLLLSIFLQPNVYTTGVQSTVLNASIFYLSFGIFMLFGMSRICYMFPLERFLSAILDTMKIGSWRWNARSLSGVTKDILTNFIDKKGAIVKSNDIREIRLIDGFFVKYEKPLSIIAGIVNCFSPKAKSEFESAMLLESNGIPCVDYCGWGFSGSRTIIFSRELKDSENAYDVWFKRLAFLPPDSPERSQFLNNLAIFLRKFFKKGLFHPDLHPGNLLVRKSDMEFFVVDPYGIKDIPSLSESKLFKMQRIWGAFRGELSEKEAVELILKSEMAPDEAAAKKLWREILYAESDEMKKLWIKRKERMRSGKNSKYFSMAEKENGTLFLRKGLRETPPDDVEKLQAEFVAKKVPWPESERLWFRSLYLQFQRLDHIMPVGWLKRSDGELDVVFWEKENELSGTGSVPQERLDYFIERCRAAGITAEREKIRFDKIFSRLVITDIGHLKKS